MIILTWNICDESASIELKRFSEVSKQSANGVRKLQFCMAETIEKHENCEFSAIYFSKKPQDTLKFALKSEKNKKKENK